MTAPVRIEERVDAYGVDPVLTEAVHALYRQVLRGNPERGMRGSTSVLTAWIDDELVGFKAGRRTALTFESTSGAVDPAHRRRGVATALMRAQHEALTGLLRDGGRITTSTLNCFRPMLLLNLAHGFQIVAVESTREPRPAPYLRLTRKLDLPVTRTPASELGPDLRSVSPHAIGPLVVALRAGFDVVGTRHTDDGLHLLLERSDPSPFGPATYVPPQR